MLLVSSEKLTLKETLEIYRMKDAIEKVFQSLKNDINIKPLRVWTTKSLYGAILIGFLAQLIISLMRYDYEALRNIAPKFIKISLMNLTVTIEMQKSGSKRSIFSNFDSINELICCKNREITWFLLRKLFKNQHLSNWIFQSNNQETVKLGY